MKRPVCMIVAAAILILLFGSETRAEVKKAAGTGEYVGSEKCNACHKTQYRSWKETYHSKMVRKPSDGLLAAAAEKWASDGANPGPTTGNVTGKPFKLAAWSTSSDPTGSSAIW